MNVPEQPAIAGDALLAVALDERALRHQAVDALDQKAGVLLAFDAALLGIAVGTSPWWLALPVGLVCAVAAYFCFQALRLLDFKGIDVTVMRAKYLHEDLASVRVTLLDTVAASLSELHEVARGKKRWLSRGFIASVAALALFVALATLSRTVERLEVSHVRAGAADAGGTRTSREAKPGRPGLDSDLHEGR